MSERIDIGKSFFRKILVPLAEDKFETTPAESADTRPLESVRLRRETFLKIMQSMDNVKMHASEMTFEDGIEIVKLSACKDKFKKISKKTKEYLFEGSEEEILMEFVYSFDAREMVVKSRTNKACFTLDTKSKTICLQGKEIVDKKVLSDAIMFARVAELQTI